MHRPLGSQVRTQRVNAYAACHSTFTQQTTFEQVQHRIALKKEGRRLEMLSLKLVIPTALVIIGSAGAATLFLHWLLLHQVRGRNVWQDHAFHLDEGTKLHGENEAARLFGLTISSAAVCCYRLKNQALPL